MSKEELKKLDILNFFDNNSILIFDKKIGLEYYYRFSHQKTGSKELYYSINENNFFLALTKVSQKSYFPFMPERKCILTYDVFRPNKGEYSRSFYYINR